MSTAHHPPRPMVAGRSPADDDQLRFDRFWVAYTASAESKSRWMTSVAAAWGHTAPDAASSAVR